ncbi:hypothetical protein [Halobacteriovorax sp. RZ-2]|uniref:hypothetical protein n=1 Tax=unclassified Halobacteriovorax TaxID=2639665 RepID=UPI00371C5CEF
MDSLGTVIAILNEKNLLIKVNRNANHLEGRTFKVVEKVKLPEDRKVENIDSILFPKGRITLMLYQGESIYLANVVTETKTVTKKIIKEGGRKALSSLLNPFDTYGETEEITQKVPLKSSAQLSKSQSLEIRLENEIKIGDYIIE